MDIHIRTSEAMLTVPQPTSRLSAERLDRTFAVALLVIALVLGAVARLNIVQPDFPYNDGAMFLQMTEELKAANYALPWFTRYNFLDIPYAYPPFGFYLTAFLSDLLPVTPLELIRVLPVIFNLLTIPAVYLLGRNFLKSRSAAAFGALVYGINASSYEWFIMGGGLTRASGYLFAILAVDQIYKMYTRRQPRYIVTAALLSALSILSHAQMGQFALVGAAVAFVFYGLSWTGVRYSVAVVIGVAALVAPWLLTVISRHGIEPFRNAVSVASPGLDRLDIPYTTRMDLYLGFGTPEWLAGPASLYTNFVPVIGLLKLVFDRRWFLPAWWLVNLIAASRGAPARAGLFVGLAGAVVVFEVVWPGLRWLVRKLSHDPSFVCPTRRRVIGVVAFGFVSAVVSMLVITSPRNFAQVPTAYRFYTVNADERAAMQWVADYTLPTCRFALVGIGKWWGRDAVDEWFPYLTGRQSLITVQGSEWLSDPGQDDMEFRRALADRCVTEGPACLNEWSQITGQSFTHVWIDSNARNPMPNGLRRALAQSPDYTLLYNRGGVMIFARKDTPCPLPGSGDAAPDRLGG
jgi:hypothetical protein